MSHERTDQSGSGRVAEAETADREALAIQRKLYKPDASVLLNTLLGLNNILRKEGKLDETETLSLEIQAAATKAPGHAKALGQGASGGAVTSQSGPPDGHSRPPRRVDRSPGRCHKDDRNWAKRALALPCPGFPAGAGRQSRWLPENLPAWLGWRG